MRGPASVDGGGYPRVRTEGAERVFVRAWLGKGLARCSRPPAVEHSPSSRRVRRANAAVDLRGRSHKRRARRGQSNGQTNSAAASSVQRAMCSAITSAVEVTAGRRRDSTRVWYSIHADRRETSAQHHAHATDESPGRRGRCILALLTLSADVRSQSFSSQWCSKDFDRTSHHARLRSPEPLDRTSCRCVLLP
jgi:hypothetical protein